MGPAAALPRAASEHTDHDSADAPGYPRHSGADGQLRPAGDWAHLANVGALAQTKTLPLCTVTGPSLHLQTEKNNTSTPDLWRHTTPPHQRFPPGFSRTMRPGQSASLYAPSEDRVSHGTSFLAPGSLARRRHARVIHHHRLHRGRRLGFFLAPPNRVHKQRAKTDRG